MEFVQSELVLAHQYTFCGLCLSTDFAEHKSSCLTVHEPTTEMPEAKEPLVVNVFRHMPPRVDGCPLEDSQCAACQLALSPSTSFWQVNLCEKDLLGSSLSAMQATDVSMDLSLDGLAPSSRGFSLAQVSYCIEMCEETFKVICHKCSASMSRAEFRDHSC